MYIRIYAKQLKNPSFFQRCNKLTNSQKYPGGFITFIHRNTSKKIETKNYFTFEINKKNQIAAVISYIIYDFFCYIHWGCMLKIFVYDMLSVFFFVIVLYTQQ